MKIKTLRYMEFKYHAVHLLITEIRHVPHTLLQTDTHASVFLHAFKSTHTHTHTHTHSLSPQTLLRHHTK